VQRLIYRYRFERDVPLKSAHDSLLLSVIVAECLHGESRVRLEAAYRFSRHKRACVIDVRSPVGRDIARIFTGLAMKEFGSDAFTVERIDPAECPEPVCARTEGNPCDA
jgi:hypothetical protein